MSRFCASEKNEFLPKDEMVFVAKDQVNGNIVLDNGGLIYTFKVVKICLQLEMNCLCLIQLCWITLSTRRAEKLCFTI